MDRPRRKIFQIRIGFRKTITLYRRALNELPYTRIIFGTVACNSPVCAVRGILQVDGIAGGHGGQLVIMAHQMVGALGAM